MSFTFNENKRDKRDHIFDLVPNRKLSKNTIYNRPVYLNKTKKRKQKKGEFKKIVVINGKIEPVFFPKSLERNTYLLVGPSGSGKSTYASTITKEYHSIWPERKIFLISPKNYDPVFDSMVSEYGDRVITRVNLNPDSFLPEKCDLNLMREALFIYDDYEGIGDKKMRLDICAMRDKQLLVGRSYKISVITINHILMNSKNTKVSINESMNLVIFNSGVSYQIQRYLHTYLGLNQGKIEELLRLPSRWIQIFQFYPKYILSEDCAYVI